jgi:CelD/BcsL family acetyltransferase involved in cellulose biosynthesis
MRLTAQEYTVERIGAAKWRTSVARYRDADYRQSWAYAARLAREQRAEHDAVRITCGGDEVGIALVRIKRAPVIGSGLAYISGGPLVMRRDGDSGVARRSLHGCLEALTAEYVDRRGLNLRIQPSVALSEAMSDLDRTFIDERYEEQDGGKAYRTMLVDLDRPAEAIRASLRQKWRNALNRAERNGLRIARGGDAALFDEFTSLHERFVREKDLDVPLSAGFFRRVHEDAVEAERLTVALAYDGEALVAGHLCSMMNDMCVYLLGATTERGRALNAAYRLQWETIVSARTAGCRFYDLGGVDPSGNPGVHHFKRGMNGKDIRAAGPFERSPATVRARLAARAERMYRRLSRAA